MSTVSPAPPKRKFSIWLDKSPVRATWLWADVALGCMWLALGILSLAMAPDDPFGFLWLLLSIASFSFAAIHSARPAPGTATHVYRAGYLGVIASGIAGGIYVLIK